MYLRGGRRTAVVLACARPLGRAVEPLAGISSILAGLIVAGAAKQSDGLVPLREPRGHERTECSDRQLAPGQRTARGIGAALGQPVGLSRHEVVKPHPVRNPASSRLGVARRGGFGGSRWAKALVVVLRHRCHLRRQRLLQQVLAHGPRR